VTKTISRGDDGAAFLMLDKVIRGVAACAVVLVWLCGVAGCSSKQEAGGNGAPLKPKEAATQLQQAFNSAPEEIRQSAVAASEALKGADYERAVRTLEAIKAKPNLSLDQGLAVHASEVSLESRLITAMASGDPKARQAYEALKKSRRN